MGETREVRFGWREMTIAGLLTLCLSMSFFIANKHYYDWRLGQAVEQNKQYRTVIKQTQTVFDQVAFPENIAAALRRTGWAIKERTPQLPVEPDIQKDFEGDR